MTIRDPSAQAEISSLWVNVETQAERIRTLEKMIDTRNTPLYQRIWFRIDGWPPWYVVGTRKHRWWHNG
jgi:hypothetical protein